MVHDAGDIVQKHRLKAAAATATTNLVARSNSSVACGHAGSDDKTHKKQPSLPLSCHIGLLVHLLSVQLYVELLRLKRLP